MRDSVAAFLSLTVFFGCAAAAQAQDSSLDKTIMQESSALGALGKSFGSDLGSMSGLARQMGDPNFSSEFSKVSSSSSTASLSSNKLMGEIASMSKQARSIPGLGQMFSTLNLLSSNTPQFKMPPVSSTMLRTAQSGYGVGNMVGGANSSGASTIQRLAGLASSGNLSGAAPSGTMSLLGSLLGSTSGPQSAAVNSELKQAGSVMPEAVQNLEQENADINQLLKE